MAAILVVDDEIDTLNLLQTILEISGYQAFTTLHSIDAITLAEVEHPDCILLDIMMPQLDGFTLCKMMRLHPTTKNLPIVFVTAYAAHDLEDRRVDAGADMVLPKPIGMDTLVEAIEKATTIRLAKVNEGIAVMPASSPTQPVSTVTTPPTTMPASTSSANTTSSEKDFIDIKPDTAPEPATATQTPSVVPAPGNEQPTATANNPTNKPDEAKPTIGPIGVTSPAPIPGSGAQ